MHDERYNYQVLVEFSSEDACFLARIPAFPLVMAHGDTPDEAVREAYEGLGGVIAAMRDEDRELPTPDRLVETLRRLKPILKVSELARRVGMPSTTLASKIARGGPFTKGEREKVDEALRF